MLDPQIFPGIHKTSSTHEKKLPLIKPRLDKISKLEEITSKSKGLEFRAAARQIFLPLKRGGSNMYKTLEPS